MSGAGKHKGYGTDLTDEQWTIVDRELPPAPGGGRERTVDLRQVVNAILYRLRTGCSWEMLPNDFPPKSTVYEDYANGSPKAGWARSNGFRWHYRQPIGKDDRDPWRTRIRCRKEDQRTQAAYSG